MILIGIGLVAGGRYVYNLTRTQNKAAVQLGGRVHKMTMQGIELLVSFNIKNPGNSSMEMAIPLIKLFHSGTLLGASSMTQVDIPDATKGSNGRIRIPANSETGVISTIILLPYLSLTGLGANLVATLKDRLKGGSQKVKFTVETNTTIFTPLGGEIPYDDKQVIAV
ncbi:MAG: hypothetical protein NXI10_05500 [bacterium]|nr:hypothetical protein [bacterium]